MEVGKIGSVIECNGGHQGIVWGSAGEETVVVKQLIKLVIKVYIHINTIKGLSMASRRARNVF